jgi:hypothetical protein
MGDENHGFSDDMFEVQPRINHGYFRKTIAILGKPWLFWKLPPTINQPM